MNITKVKYERLFPCGAYLNEKIGFEAEIGSVVVVDKQLSDIGIYPQKLESPQDVINQLRQLAEDIHKEKYPHFYEEESSQKENSVQPKESAIESHIKTINECKTLNNLKIFEKLVHNTNDENLTLAYMKKHEELYKAKKVKT